MASRKHKFAVNQLVVLNHLPDATIYRIKAIDGFRVMIVNRDLEDSGIAWQSVDISMLKPLSIGQLRRVEMGTY